MRIRNLSLLIILMISLMLFLTCQSEQVVEKQEPVGMQWKIPRGVEIDREAVSAEFEKFGAAVITAFNDGKFDVVGSLFEKKGAILYTAPEGISGVKEITRFFEERAGQELRIDMPESIEIGMINKTVWMEELPEEERVQPIDMYAKVHFKVHLELKKEGQTLQNDTFPGDATLLHRKVCSWDG